MSNKFIGRPLEVLSAITTIIAVHQFFTHPETSPWLKLLFISLAVASVVFSICYKRRYEETYNLLLAMAKNNKLHPLRGLIMVLDKYYNSEAKNYKFKIGSSIFTYQISDTETGSRDVNYMLELHLQLSWIKRVLLKIRYAANKIPDLCFYAICENSPPSSVDVEVGGEQIGNVAFEPVTLSGRDRSEEFAGLYGLSFRIPHKIICHHSEIKVLVKYKVVGQIIKDAKQYTFVVMPLNYGKTISCVEMRIKGHLNSTPELQKFSPKYPYFDNEHTPKFESRENQQYYVDFNPSKKCVYVAQIELPDSSVERK